MWSQPQPDDYDDEQSGDGQHPAPNPETGGDFSLSYEVENIGIDSLPTIKLSAEYISSVGQDAGFAEAAYKTKVDWSVSLDLNKLP